jgi:uncharacterized protein
MNQLEVLKTKNQRNEIDLSPLRVLLARIEETYHPLQVWLFGSRARGEHRPNSDWDLLVVVPDDVPDELFDPEISWQTQKGSGVYADVIPWPVSNFKEDWTVVNSLPHEIARDGVLVYER